MTKKNILLFRGENTRDLKLTLDRWQDEFMRKHGEMNLLVVDRENMPNTIVMDCMAPGFMGGMRMVVFRDKLIKTARELRALEAEEEAGKTVDLDDLLTNGSTTKKEDTDTAWIHMCETLPETNFLLFVGNKKPVGELENWLEANATIKDFSQPSVQSVQEMVKNELGLSALQAEIFCHQLGFYEEFMYGKTVVIGKPDYIYQEVKKLKLTGKIKWTNEELKSILPDYREESSFGLMDALWEKQARGVQETWTRLMETADHELTMASIITMIRKILVCATFPDIGNIPVTPGQKKTGARLRYEQKNIKKLYDRIVAVDIAEKSGELPHKSGAFLMALLSYCV